MGHTRQIQAAMLKFRILIPDATLMSPMCSSRDLRNGTVFPVSGMDFVLKMEEDEDSDL